MFHLVWRVFRSKAASNIGCSCRDGMRKDGMSTGCLGVCDDDCVERKGQWLETLGQIAVLIWRSSFLDGEPST